VDILLGNDCVNVASNVPPPPPGVVPGSWDHCRSSLYGPALFDIWYTVLGR
jgi:hypothetical protein